MSEYERFRYLAEEERIERDNVDFYCNNCKKCFSSFSALVEEEGHAGEFWGSKYSTVKKYYVCPYCGERDNYCRQLV